MLQNKQSHSHSLYIQYDVGGFVICISNKVEYLDKKHISIKILPKKLYCHYKLISRPKFCFINTLSETSEKHLKYDLSTACEQICHNLYFLVCVLNYCTEVSYFISYNM